MKKKCAQNRHTSYPKHPRLSKIEGEIFVSGRSHLDIHCRKIPMLAFAWFDDKEPPIVGCGNHRHDYLGIEIFKKGSRWTIRIFWDIESGGIRHIVWEAVLMKRWFYALLGWIFRY